MLIVEKFHYYGTYKKYMDYIATLKKHGANLSFTLEEFQMCPVIFNEYRDFITLPKDELVIPHSEEELDEIIIDHFLPFFPEKDKWLLLKALEYKNIIPEYETCTTYLDGSSFSIVLNEYDKITNIALFMHELIHIFIYRTKNPHINSEVISILFELIARDFCDELVRDGKYMRNHVNTLLDSSLSNIHLMSVYPKLSPVILPYVKAEYLAYELFLGYKRDPERFIYDFKSIIEGDLLIEDYLSDTKTTMSMKTFKKIEGNHKKLLTKL